MCKPTIVSHHAREESVTIGSRTRREYGSTIVAGSALICHYFLHPFQYHVSLRVIHIVIKALISIDHHGSKGQIKNWKLIMPYGIVKMFFRVPVRNFILYIIVKEVNFFN